MSERPAIDLVILSSVHWHFTWQRHQEVASRLAGLGYHVTYVEPIPKRWPALSEWRRVTGRLLGRHVAAGLSRQRVPAGVELVSPLMLPDVGPLTRGFNRGVATARTAAGLEARVGRPRVVINYLPLAASIDLQRRLAPDLAIYDCVWDWPHDPYSRRRTIREEELLAAVDMVFADSPYLFDRMRRAHARVERVLPAVDYELYAPARAGGPPGDGRPRCAYFGALGANIDLPLLRRLSHEFSLRLIGPVQEDLGSMAPGTEILGPVPQAELPALLAPADVLVLPYRRAPHSAGVIPAKTFECLATGKPCVVSGLDSLVEFGGCFERVEGEDSFVAAVRAAAGAGEAGREERLALARANSWETRAAQIDDLVRRGLEDGASG